ncbi:MAG: ABC transporter permease [Cytophagales bacterium]|nr:ABC transporter permease [Armatimonadota bacterium]
MLSYVLRRVLYAVPILVGVSLLTFALFYLTTSPENLARRNISAKNPSPAQIQQWLKDHHYDKSRSEQFKDHMTSLATFRFGTSDATGQPIAETIRRGAGPSFVIGSLVFVTTLYLSLTLAIIAAYFRGTYVDLLTTIVTVLVMSIAYIVYVNVGQYLLGKVLKWGPLTGFEFGLGGLRFAALPVLIGAIAGFGGGARLYRTFLLDEINQDYVRTARAKGVSERAILLRHVLKNALIPLITSTVAAIPSLILGGVVTENFFNIPGLGSALVDAINGQDFAMVRAMVFLGTLLYIVGLILTDIAYALADPRVRLE